MPEFTRYAQMRMEQRGVTEADVESALSHRVGPDKPGKRRGRREILGIDTRGEILKVIVNELNEVVNVLRDR